MTSERACKRLGIPPPARSEAIADLERVDNAILDRLESLEQKVDELEKKLESEKK